MYSHITKKEHIKFQHVHGTCVCTVFLKDRSTVHNFQTSFYTIKENYIEIGGTKGGGHLEE